MSHSPTLEINSDKFPAGLEILANTIPKGATGSKSGPIHHAFIRSLILGTRPEGYISLCSSISKARKPNYSAVKAPLLLLAGGDDKTAPLASSQAILEAYGTESQKKTLEILDGVGHWHCVEAPEEVSRFILAFIKSIS
jgi:pimeloyl-ACP methyl ester carboxylesterase